MNKNVYRLNKEIYSYETNFKQELSLPGLLNLLEYSAWRSACDLGFGDKWMEKEGVYWVLYKLYVEPVRLPKWQESIEIDTWPYRMEGLSAYRNFEIFIDNKPEIGVCSQWLVVDQKTGRPKRASQLLSDEFWVKEKNSVKGDFYKYPVKSLFEEIKPEIKKDSNLYRSMEVKADYSQIDLNQHVNNAVYSRWISDLAGMEFFSNHSIINFQLDFMEETKPGDSVFIEMFNDKQNSRLFFEGKKNKGITFRGTIQYD